MLLVLSMSNVRQSVVGAVLLLVLAACGGSEAVEPTQIASVAPTAVPTTPPLPVPTVTPVPTPVPVATATSVPAPTPTPVEATATPESSPTPATDAGDADAQPAPTAAAVEPTPAPTAATVATPTAAPTPIPTPIPTSTPLPTATPDGDDGTSGIGTGTPPVAASPTVGQSPTAIVVSGEPPLECYDRVVKLYRGFVEGNDSISFEGGRVYCNPASANGVSAARSYRHQSGLVVQRNADYIFNNAGTGYIPYSGALHFCSNGAPSSARIVADTVPQLLVVIDNETRNQIAQGASAPATFTASGTRC